MKSSMLNLGCGNCYHKQWINADIRPATPEVFALDLSRSLPFESESFAVVYHSHLLEHLPRYRVSFFLRECFRVLKPGGILRVVVPDLESIARAYIELLDRSLQGDIASQKRYEWIVLELFDQMVRNQSGGEMLNYWKRNPMPAEDFVIERVGSEVLNVINEVRQRSTSPETGQPLPENATRIGEFRLSGEVHQWMYDRYSLKLLLETAGFGHVRQCRADESSISDFNSYLLDIEATGIVRKPDSLFMEAVKL